MSTTQNTSTQTPRITETFFEDDTQPVPMLNFEGDIQSVPMPMPELEGDIQSVPMPMPELENDAVQDNANPVILVGDARGTSEDTALLWPDDCYPPKIPFLPLPCPLTGNTFIDVAVDIDTLNIFLDNTESVYLGTPESFETPDPISNLI